MYFVKRKLNNKSWNGFVESILRIEYIHSTF